MKSFGNSNVKFVKGKNDLLRIQLSRIVLWNREDFYLSKNGLLGMIYSQIFEKETEEAKIMEEYFDVNQEFNKKFEKDGNGLSFWNKPMLESVLTIKKGKKFKIEWLEYDWGTNSK